jgi:riboflavin kinase/FMN adenylyltransferase
LLRSDPPVRGICVGSKWRFGRGGDGDTKFLAAELARRNIAFNAVPELRMNGTIISSSAIREAVAVGDISFAADMLGVFPALYGEVESGFGIAGSELHMPTANIRVDFGILPPDGVYAGRTELDGKTFPAVINIGFSPTFGGTPERRVECHIIGFSGDLYRRKLAVELAARLRDERKFASAEELAKQIRLDRERALEILSSTGVGK